MKISAIKNYQMNFIKNMISTLNYTDLEEKANLIFRIKEDTKNQKTSQSKFSLW